MDKNDNLKEGLKLMDMAMSQMDPVDLLIHYIEAKTGFTDTDMADLDNSPLNKVPPHIIAALGDLGKWLKAYNTDQLLNNIPSGPDNE